MQTEKDGEAGWMREMRMNVLIACEETQAVCKEFRRGGHKAFSCDLSSCRFTDNPEWHIMEDARLLLDGFTTFVTMDGQVHHEVDACEWDLIIAHPPCTYLTGVAVKFHSTKVSTVEEINERTKLRIEGINFFMRCATANCKRIAIENPIGIMGTVYRKPDQIIEPYMFAESEEDKANYVTKRTCLWLKGLPALETNDLEKPNNAEMFGKYSTGRNKTWVEMSRSAEVRSRTFPGIARAMAEQWGKI